jgi:PAS domain S-box-containing protein
VIPRDHHGCLAHGDEMGARMRAHNWDGSALGNPQRWPETLKAVVPPMLASQFPMFVLWGEHYACLYNDSFIPVLGKRHPGALGRAFQGIFPEIWSAVHPLILRARGGESLYFESLPLRLERNNYEEDATFTLSAAPLRNGEGHVEGIFCVCIETTEHLRAEAKLRDSEARWRGLFNNMQEGFVLAQALRDADGRMVDFLLLEINPGFERQTGLRAEAVIGRSAREVLPTLQEALVDLYAEVLNSGEPRQFETKVPALGSRWFEVRVRKAEADKFAVLFLDITARKASETALQESEAAFRGLTQALPNHVWTSDPDGSLNWFNDRVHDYSGAAHEALQGMGWTRLVHPKDLALAAERWGHAIRSGTSYQTEFRLLRADGKYRWHIARAIPLCDENGAIKRWIGTNTDIHDQKRVEQELADLNTTLESRISQRSSELEIANEALRQSQKREAVGQLTGGIAHDFYNLLTGVIGGLDMLRTRLAQRKFEEIERYLDAAAGSAKRAAALTHRLLAFSRKQPLKPDVVEVNVLVKSVRNMFQSTLGPHIQLATQYAPELWLTLCDPNQLESTLLNLIINARDAMPEGGLLTVETTNVTIAADGLATQSEIEPGDYVCLSVSDAGQGMPAEVVRRAFEPFFTTKPIGHGTGLGLSMAYGFARQSLGYIHIESSPGNGTAVRLYLPRYRGHRRASPSSYQEEVATRALTPISRAVLVVEDERIIRELMVEVLGEQGYTCLQASSGTTALEYVKVHDTSIDLLVTDVGLPDVNGREVARLARLLRPNLKVLFITGYAEDAIFDGRDNDGSMEMLPKPFGVKALISAVNGLLPP